MALTVRVAQHLEVYGWALNPGSAHGGGPAEQAGGPGGEQRSEQGGDKDSQTLMAFSQAVMLDQCLSNPSPTFSYKTFKCLLVSGLKQPKSYFVSRQLHVSKP